MKTIITILLTIVFILILIIIYIYSGAYDPGALKPHGKLFIWAINKTLDVSVERRAKSILLPAKSTADQIQSGFAHYNEMCVICHSAPGQDVSEIAKGLYPDPPLIYKYASHLKSTETFWIIKNGIKMTGMPAFAPTHDDQKIWELTAFVTQKLESMKPDEYKNWQEKYNMME